MIKINLLPYREALRRQNIITHGVVAGSVLLVLLIILSAVDLYMRSQIKTIKSEIARIEKEITRNKVSLDEINQLKKEKENYARQFQIIEDLRQNKAGPVRILDELAQRVPDKIWLLTLKHTFNNLELIGIAVDNKLLSQFMTNLEDSPYFKKVDLITSEMKIETIGKTKEKLNKFTLTCLVEKPTEG